VKKRLDSATKPKLAYYQPPFEPPAALGRFISEAPKQLIFVLLWTPRYIIIQPVTNSAAEASEIACKRQINELASSRVRIVDWSESRPENSDPAFFYETNHYRETLAVKIEKEIAASLQVGPSAYR
jgi:hypothetical protein